jgi:hypothetical protein
VAIPIPVMNDNILYHSPICFASGERHLATGSKLAFLVNLASQGATGSRCARQPSGPRVPASPYIQPGPWKSKFGENYVAGVWLGSKGDDIAVARVCNGHVRGFERPSQCLVQAEPGILVRNRRGDFRRLRSNQVALLLSD